METATASGIKLCTAMGMLGTTMAMGLGTATLTVIFRDHLGRGIKNKHGTSTEIS